MKGTTNMDARISLVTLGVADLARSRRFYTEGLGWRESSASNDSICFIQLNGLALGLYPYHLLAEDMQQPAAARPAGFGGITLAYNGRTKEEVDAVLALAAKAGATILKPAQDVFWGGYSGYFADPDGYAWEVAWNPGFPLDAAGNMTVPE